MIEYRNGNAKENAPMLLTGHARAVQRWRFRNALSAAVAIAFDSVEID